jgi:cytidine deaminase
MPFLGISPFRYRDIFQKGRRKNADGTAKVWYYDDPRPMIDIVSFSYIRVEPLAYANLLANIEREDPPIATEGESGNVRPAQE